MPKQDTLAMFERDTTLTPSRLRSIGYIPATIYGKQFSPRSVQVKAHDFELAYRRGIKHFRLEGMGEALTVELKQLQWNHALDKPIHIEFYIPAA